MADAQAETQSLKSGCSAQEPESEISSQDEPKESESDELFQLLPTATQKLGILILSVSFWVSLIAIAATVALATVALFQMFAGSCTAALIGIYGSAPLIFTAIVTYPIGIILVNRHKATIKKKATIAVLAALVILPLSAMGAMYLSVIPHALSMAGIEAFAEMPDELSESEQAEFVHLIQQQADDHWGVGMVVVEDVFVGMQDGMGRYIAQLRIVGLDEVHIERGLWFDSLQDVQVSADSTAFKWDPDVIDDDTKGLFRAFALQTKDQVDSWGQTEELKTDYPGREVWEVRPARKSSNLTSYVFEKTTDGQWIFLEKITTTL